MLIKKGLIHIIFSIIDIRLTLFIIKNVQASKLDYGK